MLIFIFPDKDLDRTVSISSMLSNIFMLLTGGIAMEVHIELDRVEPAYTDRDEISGNNVLTSETSLSLSAIELVFSGVSISIVEPGENSEVHHVNDLSAPHLKVTNLDLL
jgi:hypothetical protein